MFESSSVLVTGLGAFSLRGGDSAIVAFFEVQSALIVSKVVRFFVGGLYSVT